MAHSKKKKAAKVVKVVKAPVVKVVATWAVDPFVKFWFWITSFIK